MTDFLSLEEGSCGKHSRSSCAFQKWPSHTPKRASATHCQVFDIVKLDHGESKQSHLVRNRLVVPTLLIIWLDASPVMKRGLGNQDEDQRVIERRTHGVNAYACERKKLEC